MTHKEYEKLFPKIRSWLKRLTELNKEAMMPISLKDTENILYAWIIEGKTQETLATQHGVTQGRISQILRGKDFLDSTFSINTDGEAALKYIWTSLREHVKKLRKDFDCKDFRKEFDEQVKLVKELRKEYHDKHRQLNKTVKRHETRIGKLEGEVKQLKADIKLLKKRDI